jgi:DNA-directed RNA polymerase subunit RPC12/RpoP
LTIAERLRNGEKVICAKCKKGYYVTDAKDISTSHGFYCNRCNSMVNIDPVIDIE